MKYLKTLFLPLIIFFVIATSFWYWREKTKPVESIDRLSQLELLENEGARDFTATTIDGRKVALSSFRGKVVIVNLWATWCGPCIEEVPSLIKLVEAMQGKVQLFAVSEDESMAEINSFLKSFPKIKNQNIHIIWDEKREIINLYKGDRLPETFIFNADLKLAKKVIGAINWHTPDSKAYLETLMNK
jgi:cytochrome c biogenesis protein CcmG, thiol:disulfide interchange protein DsbE